MSFSQQKPGLHTVVTITEHASDDAPKRILKLPTYRLHIFLVKYEYLRSLQFCKDQDIPGKLRRRVRKHVLSILTTYMETRLKSHNCAGNAFVQGDSVGGSKLTEQTLLYLQNTQTV